MSGVFISIEGPEGSGKTTISKLIKNELVKRGFDVVLTREPGGIDISEQIRNIILDSKNVMMDSKTEALLYAAARRQHLVEKVLPALNQGAIVLCDRFVDSSLVYQGVARGLGIEKVYDINLFAIEDVMPNCTIFFDIDPCLGLQRINNDSSREVNRLDLEGIEFHQKVYQGYKEVVKKYSDRIIEVDASKTVEEVYQDVLCIIEDYL